MCWGTFALHHSHVFGALLLLPLPHPRLCCSLLPILYEFAPHLIIVSAGFDAVRHWVGQNMPDNAAAVHGVAAGAVATTDSRTMVLPAKLLQWCSRIISLP
jgi:hypothetical protein